MAVCTTQRMTQRQAEQLTNEVTDSPNVLLTDLPTN